MTRITFINPPGLKSFSGLQMHTPNPPLGLAYVAASVRDAGYQYSVIDGAGAALDQISVYPDREDLMIQGLDIDQIVARIPLDTTIIGIACLFSTLWPVTKRIADAARERFSEALLVLGSEHGTAVPEHVLRNSAFDVVVLGEAEETVLRLIAAHEAGTPFSLVRGVAFLEDGQF